MSRIITALDFADAALAQDFVRKLEPELTRVKIGNQLFTLGGPSLVEFCQTAGFDVFLDLKFHDIPNTVASAVEAAAEMGVWMVNVHASGGRSMLQAARRAVKPYQTETDNTSGTRLIAVTVLTSLESHDLSDIGIAYSPAEQVARLTALSVESHLDGVVCSPQEVSDVRKLCPADFLTITPGVRPSSEGKDSPSISSHGGQVDDQRRTMTPADAVLNGSDYLVIGRPVTQAVDPIRTLQSLNHEIEEAFDARRAASAESTADTVIE